MPRESVRHSTSQSIDGARKKRRSPQLNIYTQHLLCEVKSEGQPDGDDRRDPCMTINNGHLERIAARAVSLEPCPSLLTIPPQGAFNNRIRFAGWPDFGNAWVDGTNLSDQKIRPQVEEDVRHA